MNDIFLNDLVNINDNFNFYYIISNNRLKDEKEIIKYFNGP